MAIKKVREYLANGEMNECINFLIEELGAKKTPNESVLDELILLSRQLTSVNQNFYTGVIEFDKAEVFKARISSGLLEIAKKLTPKETESKVSEDDNIMVSTYLSKIMGRFLGKEVSIAVDTQETGDVINIKIPHTLFLKIQSSIARQIDEDFEKLPIYNSQNIADEAILKVLFKISFSPKEIEIMELLALGKTSNEVAKRLSTSKTTIELHRRNIKIKTKNLFPGSLNAQDIALYLKKIGLI